MIGAIVNGRIMIALNTLVQRMVQKEGFPLADAKVDHVGRGEDCDQEKGGRRREEVRVCVDETTQPSGELVAILLLRRSQLPSRSTELPPRRQRTIYRPSHSIRQTSEAERHSPEEPGLPAAGSSGQTSLQRSPR